MRLQQGITFLISVLIVSSNFAASEVALDLKTFRKEREESLKKYWLVVVGLSWLTPGENTLGSAEGAKVKLPARMPQKFGNIYYQDGIAQIEFAQTKDVLVDGKPVELKKKYALQAESEKGKTTISWKDVEFYLIKRANGVGVRIKDAQSETLKNFKGMIWWDENPKWKIAARWKEFPQERKMVVPDVVGNSNEETIKGSVVFTYDGKEYELYPSRHEDRLSFIFKDQTSGKQSYGTGRFLNAKVNKNGEVELDFNRAYNPPCAQIQFATCPIAPKENQLPIAIEAGEKAPIGH